MTTNITQKDRFHYKHDHTKKDSKGYNGIYIIIDSDTGLEVEICDIYQQAESRCKELNKKDKLGKGITIPDEIELTYSYTKNKTATEVLPVEIHS